MTALIWYILSTTVMLLTGWYIGWRLITPSSLSSPLKWAAWISLVFIVASPFIAYYAGRFGYDKLNHFLSWIGYIGLAIVSFLFSFLLIRDVGLSLWQGGMKGFIFIKDLIAGNETPSQFADPERRRFLINITNIGILTLTSSLTAYGVFEARRKPAIKKYDIAIPDLPEDLQNLKIVQITDIHAGLTIQRDWIETIVNEVNKLSADIIAFTGDLVDGSVEKLAEDVAPVALLEARLGKFYITGNHEYYSGALPWVEKAKDLGFTVLINENKIIQKGAGKLLIAGVTDYTAGQFVPEHKTNPGAALKENEHNDAKIFLAHQPRSLYEAAQYGFDLMLSGHTHGGQFFPWNIFASLGQPFIKGLHQSQVATGAGWVYVSQGTGYWGPPVRVNARSEIGVFTLKKL